jgi:hypothetical protein
MRTIAAAAALMAMPSLAFADGSLQCVDVSVPKKAVEAGKGRWIELTSEQWQFLRGIYAMNPLTPPGLPFGDRAVLAKIDGHESGLVFFVDGNRACTPMAATKALLSLLDDVATSRISHEGSGL